MARGQAYARAGNRPAAQGILDSLRALSSTRYVALDDIGYIYASLGERDHALDWLEKAVEEKEGNIVWVYSRPEMDALRSDPRFVRLLRRMRLGG